MKTEPHQDADRSVTGKSAGEGAFAGARGFLAGAVVSLIGFLLAMLTCVPFVDEGDLVNFILLALLLLRSGLLIRLGRIMAREGRPGFGRAYQIGVLVESVVDIGALLVTIVKNGMF